MASKVPMKALWLLLFCTVAGVLSSNAQFTVSPDSNPSNGRAFSDPSSVDSVGYLAVTAGKVARFGETWVLVTQNPQDGEKRYVPVNLPEEFRITGMEIAFTGIVGAIPPNVRMVGTPFAISEIRELKYAEPPED